MRNRTITLSMLALGFVGCSGSVEDGSPPIGAIDDAALVESGSSGDGAIESGVDSTSSVTDSPSGVLDSTSGEIAVVPSTGCGKAATPGTVTRHLTVASVDRTFVVVIPAKYDPSVSHSMIFRFHGFGATGAEAVGAIGLKVPAVMIGPDTNPASGTAVAWDTSGDLAFVDAIVDTLDHELCIDKSRNFVTGYSNGGFMADAVGCHRSSVFRGVAIMESGSSGGSCGRVGMYIMHNANDMTVPISYGTALRDKWIATNGCGATSHAVTPSPCMAYDGCSAGHPVVWCSPATGGHKPSYDVALGIGAFFDSL